MKQDGFEIIAVPHVINAYCKCGGGLQEVSDGLLSKALYCIDCESIYKLKLVKVPKKQIKSAYLEQCRREVEE